MSDMSTVPLGEIAKVIRGVTFSRSEASAQSIVGFLPVLRANNIQDSLQLDHDLIYVPRKKVAQKQMIRRGDIVICTSSGSSGVVGKTAFAERDWEGSFGAFCAGIRANQKKCDPNYLYYYLRSPVFRSWTQRSSGANIKNIRKSELDLFKIPLPPLKEQHRIAAVLNKTESIRRKQKQALTLVHDLLKSVFLEMFGSPLTNSKQFPTIALGDLIKVSSGNGLTAKDMDPSGPYPVYGGNGVSGFHSEYMFDDPQLVIGRVGVYCGAVHLTQSRSWVTDNALYIREYKKPVNLTYLEWVLRFADLNQYANQAAQPLISGSRIYPIEILFPSELEQDTFAAYVERQKRLLNNLEASRKEANDLFASLSQRAFRGDL